MIQKTKPRVAKIAVKAPPKTAAAEPVTVDVRGVLVAVAPALAMLLAVAFYVAWGLAVNNGYFGYTLDDAYIHLAQAEGIWRGDWGINLGEAAAPSSSFVWPLLLAPFTPFGWQDKVPLVLGTLSLMAAAMWFARALRDAWPRGWASDGVVALAAIALAFACNGPQMVMTGLEHSLELAVLACAVWLAVRLGQGAALPRVALAGVTLLPFVRFELALPAAVLGVMLLAFRRWKEVAVVGVLGCALLAAYLLTVWLNGLPLVPSSVMAKAGFGAGVWGYVVQHVTAFYTPGFIPDEARIAWVMTGVTVVTLGLAVWGRSRAAAVPAALAMALYVTGLTLPLLFSFDLRYHAPLLLGLSGCLLAAGGAVVPVKFKTPSLRVRAAGMVILAVMLALWPFYAVRHWWILPYAQGNIIDEHYQMHRFVTEFYKGPVAVHDIGWVAYRNDAYVLDLAGLANAEVRRAVANGGLTPERIAALAAAHGIGLAMVYDNWFPDQRIPKGWVKLAGLATLRPLVSAGYPVVSFYATSPEAAPRIAMAIRAMVPTLLPNTGFFLPAAQPSATTQP